MKLVLGVLAVTMSCLAGSAVAADMASGVNQGFYLGLDVGKSFAKFADNVTDKANASFVATWGGTLGSMSRDFDKSKFSYDLFGGYMFDQNWSVELGYQVFGKASANFYATKAPATVVVPTAPTVVSYKMIRSSKVSDVYAAVVGRMPVYPGIDVYGKLGAAYVTSDNNRSMYTAPSANNWALGSQWSAKNRKLTALMGLGVSYDIGSNMSLRLEYRYLPKAFKSDSLLKAMQSLTLGLAFAF